MQRRTLAVLSQFIFCALLLFVPGLLLAHASGQSFEKALGDYVVDVGCDAFEFLPQKKQYCSIGLLYGSGALQGSMVEYDQIHASILSPDGSTLYAEEIIVAPKTMSFLRPFVFPDSGEYVMSASFIKSDHEIAAQKISLTVLGGRSAAGWTSSMVSMVQIVSMAAIGCLIVWALIRPLLTKS